MAGLNKILLIGHLGGDPEVKTIQSGATVAKMSLAVTEKYKTKNGETVSNTEWFDLEAWEGTAKIAEQYLKKGSQIFIEGKQKTEKWQNEAGENRMKKVVRITSLTMLGSGNSSGNSPAQPSNHNSTNAPAQPDLSYEQVEDDDLPF